MKLINVIPFRLTNDVKLQQVKLNVKYVSLISSNIHSFQTIEEVQNCKYLSLDKILLITRNSPKQIPKYKHIYELYMMIDVFFSNVS